MSLPQLLARQAGVITLAQAVDRGISSATVYRRARDGAWQRLYPRVYLVGGHRLTDEVRVRAAWLWAGGEQASATGEFATAVVTGAAAAYWHGMLERAPAVVEVTVPRQTHLRARPGLVVRRRDLDRQDVVGYRAILVADRPFAALETAAVLPDGSAFLDRALQRHVRFPAVYRSYCRNLGRDGSATAGTLIKAAADRADSAAERRLIVLLRAAGITGWVLGFPFGPYRIDVAFPVQKLAIEVDGWAWHVDSARFRNDRRKGNTITLAGWDLLRFTWHDLENRPGAVLTEITETLKLAA